MTFEEVTWFSITVSVDLQSGGHGLHAFPVPGVFVGDHAHLHQERDENSLPEDRETQGGMSATKTLLYPPSFLSSSFSPHQKETKTTSLTQRNLPTGLMGVSSSLSARYSNTRQYMAN